MIEPQSKVDHVYKHVRMPRLGLPILGTILKNAGYEVEIFMGTGESLPWGKVLKADLVGISTTTATCREAYQIAGALQAENIPVIIGGMHATFMPEETLQFADYLVRGEAENIILDLVACIKEGAEPRHIPAVSYWKEHRQVHNAPSGEPVNMDDLPIPDLSLLNNPGSMPSIPVMTSRGCPFDCTFCCVTEFFGRRYRHRQTESILEELKLYQGKHVFFCDDNFAANPRLTKELLRAMIREKISLKRWSAQVRADASDDSELLELMRDSGCGIVYIGFESINPETLKGYKKQQTVEDIKKAIGRFHDYGIRIHGMFVFGADTDTVETVRQTADFALKARIDTIQFMNLTPFPNTPFYDTLQQEGRIFTHDWSLYDGHHAVFYPALLSAEELQQETIHALKKFYSLKHVFHNLFLTGWGSVIHRVIGWAISRMFEHRNRWYVQLLRDKKFTAPAPAINQGKLGEEPGKIFKENVASGFKVSLTESRGTVFFELRGLVDLLQARELKKFLKHALFIKHNQVIVNIEGLRFASAKTAALFGKHLNRLGSRVRRLQVVAATEKQVKVFMKTAGAKHLRLPHFELLVNRPNRLNQLG